MRQPGMIPLAWERSRALGLGVLDARTRRPGSPAIRADSRAVGPGDLFVALNTGVDYVADAHERRSGDARPATTRRRRWRALASLVRSKSDARVVAVVGSTGKTSTKDILGALCAAVTPTVWAERARTTRSASR